MDTRKKLPKLFTRIGMIAVALAIPPLVFSQTTQEVLTNLAEQIAERRARVDELSAEVQETRDRYNDQVRSLAAQIADVEVQINREELRLDQVEQDITRAQEAIAAAREGVTDVEPLVATALARLRTYIETALPFQSEDRLEEVATLERLLSEGDLEAQTVLTRLWNTIDAEFRMTEEIGLYRQVVSVGGDEQLAEVARLGMVMLFFKTFDDRYGYAQPTGSGEWEYTLARNRAEQDQLEELFESLRRNLREGFFTLPNPYREL